MAERGAHLQGETVKKEKEQKEPEVIRVRHRKYGEGILISEDDMMIEAEFREYGRKKFLSGKWKYWMQYEGSYADALQLRSRKEMFRTAS